jgi:hypothetical protein
MDVSSKPLTDNEMDAVVVRALSRLGPHAPSRSFASNVMARVALPQPGPVVVFRRARAWASQPRHAMALAGGYALSAIVAMAVVVPWLAGQLPAIRFVADWLAARGGELVRQGIVTAAEWSVASGLSGLVRSLPLSGPGIWVAGILLVLAYAGCAVGLHFLLRAPKARDVVHVRA